MEDVRIILSASWIALMLTYLLGDVLRIYAGDFKPGKIAGRPVTQNLLLGIRDTDDGSDCHGLSLLDLELSVESLGKHHRSHSLLGLQPHRTANVFLSLRQIPHDCRSRIQRPDYLVRVAVAKLARKISFTLEE